MQPRKLIRQKLLMRGISYHDHNYSELDDQFEEESTDPNPLPALLIATPVNPTRANSER